MPLLSRTICVVLCALLHAGAAFAVSVPDLYETSQPVTTTRDAAFSDALRTVLVRVSGRRDAPARLSGAVGDARKYVQRFGFTADNVLQVGFDGPSIDRLLADAGLPIWGRERPATLVVLGVESPYGEQWVSAEAPPAERAAIQRAAQERGLPLVWASLDGDDRAQAAAGLSSPPSLQQLAQTHGANATLLGRVRGGSVQWVLASSDSLEEASGGLDAGVHMAADAFARVFAASGSSLQSVAIEVSGIATLDAYAATLNYLEGLTLVRSVAVEHVAGDAMRFRLAVRGDAETLRRALALDNRLAPASVGAAPGGPLAFRFQH